MRLISDLNCKQKTSGLRHYETLQSWQEQLIAHHITKWDIHAMSRHWPVEGLEVQRVEELFDLDYLQFSVGAFLEREYEHVLHCVWLIGNRLSISLRLVVEMFSVHWDYLRRALTCMTILFSASTISSTTVYAHCAELDLVISKSMNTYTGCLQHGWNSF